MAQSGNNTLRQIRGFFTVILCGMGYTMLLFTSSVSVYTTVVEGAEMTPERMERMQRWSSISHVLSYPVSFIEGLFESLGVPHFRLITAFLVGMILGLMLVLFQRRLTRPA